ncbi:hypothetical protein Tco_1554391, partial [Tanacetum coccineum]
SSYARALIEIQADVELKDTIVVAMHKLVGEGFYTCNIRVEYEWKPHSQAPRGVPVGAKVEFKPVKQVYRHVAKKTNTNTSGSKKKDVDPTQEVSNSTPFDVLNSVENDVYFESSSISTTPIVEKIDKIERLIIDEKVTLVDDEGKPLEKVDSSGDHDSEDEVE